MSVLLGKMEMYTFGERTFEEKGTLGDAEMDER